MEWLPAIGGAIFVFGWLLAVVSGIELVVRHPAEGRTRAWYATNGHAWFDPDAFAATGAKAHSRMMTGFGLCFLGCMSSFVLFIVAGGGAP